MLTCEACQLLIADALYGALNPKQTQSMQDHLLGCEQCQSNFSQLQAIADGLGQLGIGSGNFDDIPERAALDQLWDKLQPDLDRIDAERFRELPKRHSRKLVAGWLALAASVVLAITLLPLLSTDETPASPIAANNLISPELMNYLTRAEVMLLLVANAETQSVSAVPIRQTFARNLAEEAKVLNTTMQDNINSGQSRLLKDIEFLLLQIANLDETNMEDGVNLLQQYLEDNSVLFKIRLLEMRSQDAFI